MSRRRSFAIRASLPITTSSPSPLRRSPPRLLQASSSWSSRAAATIRCCAVRSRCSRFCATNGRVDGPHAAQQARRRHDAHAARRRRRRRRLVPGSTRQTVRAGRSAGGSVDGGGRRRARAVCDARLKRSSSAARQRRCSTAREAGRELFYLDWFASRGVRLVLTTEDGSTGERGRVTVPLERELQHARRQRHGLRLRAGADARSRRACLGKVRAALAGVGRACHGMRHGRLLQLRDPGERHRPAATTTCVPASAARSSTAPIWCGTDSG